MNRKKAFYSLNSRDRKDVFCGIEKKYVPLRILFKNTL